MICAPGGCGGCGGNWPYMGVAEDLPASSNFAPDCMRARAGLLGPISVSNLIRWRANSWPDFEFGIDPFSGAMLLQFRVSKRPKPGRREGSIPGTKPTQFRVRFWSGSGCRIDPIQGAELLPRAAIALCAPAFLAGAIATFLGAVWRQAYVRLYVKGGAVAAQGSADFLAQFGMISSGKSRGLARNGSGFGHVFRPHSAPKLRSHPVPKCCKRRSQPWPRKGSNLRPESDQFINRNCTCPEAGSGQICV